MARHNKKRNTAFIYEALVREIVKQSVAKNNEKRNAAIQIMKEAFALRTELRKELDLYKTLMENNSLQEKIAEKILVEAKTQHSMVNQDRLFKEQSVAISKINKQLSKDVFNNFVPNYKYLATLSQIFGSTSGPKTKVLLEAQVVQRLTSTPVKETQTPQVSSLVVKTFTKRFNDSYSTLLESQKQLLSNYISSFADNGLEFNFYLSEEVGRLKQVVTEAQTLEETQDDETIKENLSKVYSILENVNKEPINKNTLYKVLQIQQLEKEIVS
tara:strand:- start:4822 stop:5634 length:813 start_codon:yes stop_codon:yes gene_type:complete